MAKVLIYSPQLIGKSMAGPAIRTWEFAKALSKHHRVVLISSGPSDQQTDAFEIISFQDPICKKHFQTADVLITQRLTLPLAFATASHRLKIIIDAYDPSPLELLEQHKNETPSERAKQINSEVSTLAFSFQMAHGILCASEKQRELWLGFLLGQKLITPALYDADPSLRNYLAVVPFGLSSTSPKRSGKGLKEKLGLHADDKVILWGGGIWNWFDPLSLIKAIKIISMKRSDIKLVFMGVKPPDPAAFHLSMALEAMQLAKKLDLIDRFVFFHHDWVPYEERENFLLDADIGVSTHFDHLETRYAFRTRILDYLWAQLPVVATTGDSFAELIERHDLGATVPYQNEQALAQAFLSILENPDRIKQIKDNLSLIREQFHWEKTVAPLNQMIEQLSLLPKPRSQWQNGKAALGFLKRKIQDKGLAACFYKYLFFKS